MESPACGAGCVKIAQSEEIECFQCHYHLLACCIPLLVFSILCFTPKGCNRSLTGMGMNSQSARLALLFVALMWLTLKILNFWWTADIYGYLHQALPAIINLNCRQEEKLHLLMLPVSLLLHELNIYDRC